jgi:hypothetical protein
MGGLQQPMSASTECRHASVLICTQIAALAANRPFIESCYTVGMDGLTIVVGWPYFLGIMGSLILIAWYTNGRFTALETDTTWIKNILKSMKINLDNKDVGAFAAQSPISLTEVGRKFLNESSIKEYVDSSISSLVQRCEAKKTANPYEVQQHIFNLFSSIEFPKEVDDKIKKYAFEKGIGSDIIRRVGAIYFRDICLDNFGMSKYEIDKHDPTKNPPTAAA